MQKKKKKKLNISNLKISQHLVQASTLSSRWLQNDLMYAAVSTTPSSAFQKESQLIYMQSDAYQPYKFNLSGAERYDYDLLGVFTHYALQENTPLTRKHSPPVCHVFIAKHNYSVYKLPGIPRRV